jgi:hypothetical protein
MTMALQVPLAAYGRLASLDQPLVQARPWLLNVIGCVPEPE